MLTTTILTAWRVDRTTPFATVVHLSTGPSFMITTATFGSRMMCLSSMLLMPWLFTTRTVPFPLIFRLRATLRLTRVVFSRWGRHIAALAFTLRVTPGLLAIWRWIGAWFFLLTSFNDRLGRLGSRRGRRWVFLGLQGGDAERRQAAKPGDEVDSWFHGSGCWVRKRGSNVSTPPPPLLV